MSIGAFSRDKFITQLKDPKNRLKITGSVRSVYLDAKFLVARSYYQLIPVGVGTPDWQPFWDVWELHKTYLKAEGLSVTKEKGKWVIHYLPPQDGSIVLDESIRG